MKSNRALTGVEVAIALAVLGALGWFTLPKIFHGATRRAENSAKATAALEDATRAQGASAAASVQKIGEAAAMAEPSPAIDFIRQETPVALAKLPAPDPQSLLEAERRRTAVMEGRFELAKSLYVGAYERAEKLQSERDKALEARRQADAALLEAAAAERARTLQGMAAGAAALIALGIWLYTRVHAVRLRRLAQTLIPTLDSAYEHAAGEMKETLDRTIFDPLSKGMDQATKNLVHELRVK